MIALIIYLLAVDCLYDAFASYHSVFWAIFYFANHYAVIGAVTIIARKRSAYVWRPLYIAVGIGFISRGVLELTRIGLDYDSYYLSADSIFSRIVFSVIIVTLIISLYARKKTINR